MATPSPLDDPASASFAWTRWKRMMGYMGIATAITVVALLAYLYLSGTAASVHFYIATGLGVAATMMLMGALMGRGIRVPDDLSIIGFDNMLISTQVSPQLTTVEQNLSQKAALAVDILEHRLQNPNVPAESRVLDVRLVERGTVKARPVDGQGGGA